MTADMPSGFRDLWSLPQDPKLLPEFKSIEEFAAYLAGGVDRANIADTISYLTGLSSDTSADLDTLNRTLEWAGSPFLFLRRV
jgi:hypothetical protein